MRKSGAETSSVRMPAEWEPHERCLMGWPDENCQWGTSLRDLRQSYAEVAHAIRRFEPVTMLVSPEDLKSACNYLGSDIEILPLKVQNPWLRDIAPTFVLRPDGSKAGVCWRFNGYTGLTEWESDKDLAERICTELSIPAILSPLAMEGGGLHVDGHGALLTTDSLVFETTRNQGLTRMAAEQELRRTLGVDRIIWLPGNSNEAGTSGHIDGQTCFVAPDRIVFEETSETDEELRSAVDAKPYGLAAGISARSYDLFPFAPCAITIAAGRYGVGILRKLCQFLSSKWRGRDA